MALVSDFKSGLMWEFERVTNGSRTSSYFRLYGKEWCLKLTSRGRAGYYTNFTQYDNVVEMRSRGGKNVPIIGASGTCYVFTGGLAYSTPTRFYIRHSHQRILEFTIPEGDLYFSSQTWIICCSICSIEPLSLQINKEKKLVSYGPLPATSNQSVQADAEISPDLQSLSDDFSRLLDEEINPDATVTCGGRTWRIHRTVLIARSEVFAGMFRSGMSESETSTVKVEDLEATVLDSLLRFIYSGTVPDRDVPALYKAADKYAVLGLRKSCSDCMAKTLSPENCLDYLLVADAHSDVQLKESAISFAAEHFAEIEKVIWAEFRKEHSFLAVEVLERFVPPMKE